MFGASPSSRMPASGSLFGSSRSPSGPSTTNFFGTSPTRSPSRTPAFGGLFGTTSMPGGPSTDNVFGRSSTPSGPSPFDQPSRSGFTFSSPTHIPLAPSEPHDSANANGTPLVSGTLKTDYRPTTFGGLTPDKTPATEDAVFGTDKIKENSAEVAWIEAEDNPTEYEKILASLKRFFKEEDKADEAIIDAARKRMESRELQLRTIQSNAGSDSGFDKSQIANNDTERTVTSKTVQDLKTTPTTSYDGSMGKQGEVTSHETANGEAQGFDPKATALAIFRTFQAKPLSLRELQCASCQEYSNIYATKAQEFVLTSCGHLYCTSCFKLMLMGGINSNSRLSCRAREHKLITQYIELDTFEEWQIWKMAQNREVDVNRLAEKHVEASGLRKFWDELLRLGS